MKNIGQSFKEEMARLFILSFAVFLFILFFQPFPLGMLDYNNRLLYVTGFGTIYFLLSWLVFILIPFSLPQWFNISEWESGPPLILILFLLSITTTAFAFYIRFVGRVPISLYITFKMVLVCLLPLIVMKLLYRIKSRESTIVELQIQNKLLIAKLVEDEKSADEKEVEVISENKSEKLRLKINNILLIKSADNYIEIYHLENNLIDTKLIRNTLKNIESQLAIHKQFIRCHRTRIVNIMFIEKLQRDFSGYYLKMNKLDEKVPVSRQFLFQLKNSLSNQK